jgi:hypothetical protein
MHLLNEKAFALNSVFLLYVSVLIVKKIRVVYSFAIGMSLFLANKPKTSTLVKHQMFAFYTYGDS